MHDIRAIRETPETYAKAWSRRPSLDGKAVVAEILALDAEVRKHLLAKEAAEASRNAKSKEIGKAKASKDEALAASLMAEVATAKATIEEAGKLEAEAVAKRDDMLARLPNLPSDDVPDGADEHGNKVMRTVGTPRQFNFAPKDHADLGEALKMMDFEAAARMSGARFVVLKGQLARLERALAAFMLDIQTGENGYSETSVPLLVKDHSMFGTGQLPKFAEDLFHASLPSSSFGVGEARDLLKLLETSAYSERLTPSEIRLADLRRRIGELQNQSAVFIKQAQNARTPSEQTELYAKAVDVSVDAGHLEDEVERVGNEQVRGQVMSLAKEFRQLRNAIAHHEDFQRQYTYQLTRTALMDRFWLIPTAEVSLTNIIREQTLDGEQLPIRMTAATPCFRSEAGSAGRDLKGMIRQHQFIKVELVSITKPEDSEAEHERMTRCAEGILERLELPYRTMLLCAGDMGFGAKKTYDLEVWLPSQNTYREISSCSNCGDFQARRMDARYREAPSGDNPKPKPEFVHTLNGSGLAVGRTLVAVLENYQEADGRIRVPAALIPYMGGLEVIG